MISGTSVVFSSLLFRSSSYREDKTFDFTYPTSTTFGPGPIHAFRAIVFRLVDAVEDVAGGWVKKWRCRVWIP